METLLTVGLESWIILDGNYPDFKVGMTYRFAIEAMLLEGGVCSTSVPQYTQKSGSIYTITAQAIYVDSDVAIIDFGFFAYLEYPEKVVPGLQVDGWIGGDFDLGVDPFFYSADYSRKPQIPEIRYSITLKQIVLDTTPWKNPPDAPRTFIRDMEHQSARDVESTNAWADDGGNGKAHYDLLCSMRQNSGPNAV
ncbi:hypothetical protein [Leptospira borgpetersenii]|uniref:hypothetical protein n=1 Tax=Leptospira borgpetersenii TaxID=174 RepID=UPI000A674EC9|nr:hypothetical protein [Leptospira borgpetersenii]